MHFQIRANCSRVLPLSEKPSMQKPLIVHEEKMQNLTQEDLSPDLNSRPPLHEADVLTSQSVILQKHRLGLVWKQNVTDFNISSAFDKQVSIDPAELTF